MLEHGELDFAIIEGVFDKEKYPHRLYKRERFVGICSASHPFAGQIVTLEDTLHESLIVREKGSGTRMLLEQAIASQGYSLDNFRRCSSISNFSVICELVAMEQDITFAYEPISHCRSDLATFHVEDMLITGEFNLVYQRCGNEEYVWQMVGVVRLMDWRKLGPRCGNPDGLSLSQE